MSDHIGHSRAERPGRTSPEPGVFDHIGQDNQTPLISAAETAPSVCADVWPQGGQRGQDVRLVVVLRRFG
jgi:hypothetical protein